MSETTNKGDRMLLGLGATKPTTPVGGASEAGGEQVAQEVAAQMAARYAETQRLREALLDAGVNVELVEDPEGAEMDHLDEDEQEQFNDAVREHRAFQDELQRDLRELQRSRDALGIRRTEGTVLPSITKKTNQETKV